MPAPKVERSGGWALAEKVGVVRSLQGGDPGHAGPSSPHHGARLWLPLPSPQLHQSPLPGAQAPPTGEETLSPSEPLPHVSDLPVSPPARPLPSPGALHPGSRSPHRIGGSPAPEDQFARALGTVPAPTQAPGLPTAGAGSELTSELRRGGDGGLSTPPPAPPPPAGTEQNREKSAFI